MKKKYLIALLPLALLVTSCTVISPSSSEPPVEYTINVEQVTGGSFSTKNKAIAGEEVTISGTVDAKYVLNGFLINTTPISGYTFTMPAENVTVYPQVSLDDNTYTVTVKDNRYGDIWIDKSQGKAGDTVYVDYIPAYGYVIDGYFINGIKYTAGNAFNIKHENIVVEGIFKKAIETPACKVEVPVNNSTGVASFYYSYTDFGLKITAKVVDPLLITHGDINYQDYIQVMFSSRTNSTWVKDKTFSISCTPNAQGFMRVAVNSTMMGDSVDITSSEYVHLSSSLKNVIDKDGYNGYVASMEVSYALLNCTKSTIKNSIVICPALNDAESDINYNWKSYGTWLSPATYLVLN